MTQTAGEPLALPPGTWEIPVRGGSMQPTLTDGDQVRVLVPHDRLQRGDLLLVRAGGTRYVHRYLGLWRRRPITKGDAHPGFDGWVCRQEDILGRVLFGEPPAARALAAWGGVVTGLLWGLARRLDGVPPDVRGPAGACTADVAALNGAIQRFAGRLRGASTAERSIGTHRNIGIV